MKKNATGNHRQTLPHNEQAEVQAALNAGETVAVGAMALQHTGGDQIRVSFGARSYLVDQDILETLVDHAVSQHRHVMDDRQHARWCHRKTHARADVEALGGHPACVGREVVVQVGDREAAGYWSQDPGQEPRFFLEWWGQVRLLSVDDLRALEALLIPWGEQPAAWQLQIAISQAINDFEDGIPAGEQA